MNSFTNSVGLIAGFLTTTSLIPQIAHLYRSKSGRDISLGMYVIYSSGVLAWVIYGVLLHNFPLILWNGTALALAIVVLVMKLRFDQQELKRITPTPL